MYRKETEGKDETERRILNGLYQSKKDANEQFGWKMNQDARGNRKLFREEVGKVENCNRIR